MAVVLVVVSVDFDVANDWRDSMGTIADLVMDQKDSIDVIDLDKTNSIREFSMY